jgi:hypothetical protein
MKSRTDWDDSKELDDVVERLQTHVKLNGSMQRDNHFSGIPQSKNPVRTVMHRRVPTDPLAREASEITIRVRPPTPQSRDHDRIPVLDGKMLSQDSAEESSDSAAESEDDEGGNSTDSEAQAAKEMQHGYKLPPVTTPVRGQPLTQQQRPVSVPPSRRPTHQQAESPAPRQSQPPIRRTVPPPQRRTYDWDSKLPSVYRRKRITTTSY